MDIVSMLFVCIMSINTNWTKVLYIGDPDVAHDFSVERFKAHRQLWMLYGVYKNVGKKRNGEKKVYDDGVDDQSHVPIVLVEKLNW